MSYNLIPSELFKKESKQLLKKYPSLTKELFELRDELKENPMTGTPIGKGCYKIRLAIASKGKGKSGGARVITYVYVEGKTVYLLSIYDKSEKADITDKELLNIIKSL